MHLKDGEKCGLAREACCSGLKCHGTIFHKGVGEGKCVGPNYGCKTLYTHCGTAQDFQRLILKSDGKVICEIGDLSRKLGFYSVANGMEIHIQV